jgi:hypothetical protein
MGVAMDQAERWVPIFARRLARQFTNAMSFSYRLRSVSYLFVKHAAGLMAFVPGRQRGVCKSRQQPRRDPHWRLLVLARMAQYPHNLG